MIASLGAGDFFGETALIEKRETRATDVYCTSPVEVSYLHVPPPQVTCPRVCSHFL